MSAKHPCQSSERWENDHPGASLHGAELRNGWGVPMATDIAFHLGVLRMGKGCLLNQRSFS